jgi:hypothetical protein
MQESMCMIVLTREKMVMLHHELTLDQGHDALCQMGYHYLNIIQKLPFYVKDETRYIMIPRLINQKNTAGGSNPKNIFK